MRRRQFLGGMAGALAGPKIAAAAECVCFGPQAQNPAGSEAFLSVGSKIKITNMKVFGVSLTPDSDRPYVFVKLETDARHLALTDFCQALFALNEFIYVD